MVLWAKLLLGLVFLMSGISGLVYEVIWVRWFGLYFGNTVHATATVLAAYMGGMALGSILYGRLSDRIRRPVLLYAILEVLIGLTAFTVLFAVEFSEPIAAILYNSEILSQNMQISLRFLLFFFILIIPTTLMGGTLPVLCGSFIEKIPGLASVVGLLYMINTLGAATGCFLAGFTLIPTFGLVAASALAATGNVLAGLLAFIVDHLHSREHTRRTGIADDTEVLTTSRPTSPIPRIRYSFILICFGLSGFCSLGLEVIWTRLFLLIYGSTTYSFTIMLTVYLLGIGLGGGIFGFFFRKATMSTSRGLIGLFLTQAVVAMLILSSIPMMNKLPELFLFFLDKHGITWSSFLLAKIAISLIILFPPAFLFGGLFPLVSALVVHRMETLGQRVGTIYAVNSVGSVLGSVVCGFFIIPLFGTETGLHTLAVIMALSASLTLFSRPKIGVTVRILGMTVIVILGLVAVFIPGWNESLISIGPYFRPAEFLQSYRAGGFQQKALESDLVFYTEGLSSTATVRQTYNKLEYYIDGKVEASTQIDDMRLQKLMGVLPLLFTKPPQKSLNIGLGAGVTLSGLVGDLHGELHCVEIEPEIVNVARLFGEYNNKVLDNPHLRLIFDDGRNYVKYTRETYDIISSDPFEPLLSGAANLYSRDHFYHASQRLNPGGCMSQYLPLYQLFPDDYQAIMKTFHDVYPYVMVWYTGVDTILLGFSEKPVVSLDTIVKRMQSELIVRNLNPIGLDSPAMLLSTFAFSLGPGQDIFGPSVRINTDRNQFIEYNAPKAHLMNTVPLNVRFLHEHLKPFSSIVRQGAMSEYGDVIDEGYRLATVFMIINDSLVNRRFDKAYHELQPLLQTHPDNAYLIYLAGFSLHGLALSAVQQQEMDTAYGYLMESIRLGNDNRMVLADLAMVLSALGRLDEAEDTIERALTQAPDYAEFLRRKAMILFQKGDPLSALSIARKAFELAPRQVDIPETLIDILVNSKRTDEALDIFKKVRLDPANPQSLFRFAELAVFAGELELAIEHLEKAELLDRGNVSIKIYLTRLFIMTSDAGKAEQKMAEARRLDPRLCDYLIKNDPLLIPFFGDRSFH